MQYLLPASSGSNFAEFLEDLLCYNRELDAKAGLALQTVLSLSNRTTTYQQPCSTSL